MMGGGGGGGGEWREERGKGGGEEREGVTRCGICTCQLLFPDASFGPPPGSLGHWGRQRTLLPLPPSLLPTLLQRGRLLRQNTLGGSNHPVSVSLLLAYLVHDSRQRSLLAGVLRVVCGVDVSYQRRRLVLEHHLQSLHGAKTLSVVLGQIVGFC